MPWTDQKNITIRDSEFETVAQLSHFGWGLAIVLVGGLWGHRYMAFTVWIIYAAVKEFIYDEKFEIPEVRGSSMIDFIFQGLGGALGLLLLAIAGNE